MTWRLLLVVTAVNVAPEIADHELPSADSSMWPASEVPANAPTCCMAKHWPSAATMSRVEPVGELVRVPGASPVATSAAEAKSCNAVDMGFSLVEGWGFGE